MELRPFIALALLLGVTLAGCDSSTSSDDHPDPDGGTKLTFTVEHDWTSFGTISQPIVYAAVQDGTSIYAGTENKGLLYSDDGGTTWAQEVFGPGTSRLPSNQIYAIAIAGKKVLMGTAMGLSVWDRSVVPDTITNYLDGKNVYDLWIQGGNLYLAAKDGIYYGTLATPGGLTRAATSFATPEVLHIFNDKLYAVGRSDDTNKDELNIFNLADFAISPTKVDVTLDNGQYSGALFVNDRAILVGIDFQTYRSTDGGLNFSGELTTGGGTVMGYAYDGTNLYACKYGSDLWATDDLGENWESIPIPGYDGGIGITANDIYYDGNEFLISHNKGIVVGKIK